MVYNYEGYNNLRKHMKHGIIETHNPHRKGGPYDHEMDERKRDGEVLGPDIGIEAHLHFSGPSNQIRLPKPYESASSHVE